MNKVILMGRLTRDPDLRTTSSQVSVATFTLAVDRRYKSSSGDRQADFISIVAWRTTADFVGKYCRKGTKLVISGSLQTRTYDDKDGKKVYVTEVVADDIEFAESKRDGAGDYSDNTSNASMGNTNTFDRPKMPASSVEDGFTAIDDDDTSLPFDL
ncbi:MAG: single-stranded DNA-binding protein [Eubacteriales bacterium]|jgi:single-strand DNA-binding protein|nr:single-stranded DNA-binding protein [Eubacteriales bacterium]MDD4717564.1 single-stranded DNA-binding protein [Eubacteriales bacterium]NCU27180.1 single-stranded DNA-binding protein [Candidatus Nomurabacteria bacterium]